MGIIARIIPDVPEAVENEIKKEKLLALEATLKRSARDGSSGPPTTGGDVPSSESVL